MANITLLSWNLETYGSVKAANANNVHFVNYIAQVAFNTNANIVALIEVKWNVSATLPGLLVTAINLLHGNLVPNPWRSIRINSGVNHEAYIMLYRIDQNFFPKPTPPTAAAAAAIPANGLGTNNVAGVAINFPSRMTQRYGRRPYYATFRTTDSNRYFSIISYHAQFGYFTPYGVVRLPALDFITQFDNPGHTVITRSMISGDFNVDIQTTAVWYANMLAISTQSVNQRTTLMNNPFSSDDPADFRASAYDNIFQKTPGATGVGTVVDLMVESSVVTGPQPPPPAAQPHVGNLSAAAGFYNIANIGQRFIANAVAAVPTTSMDDAWGFVREAISNHYPVVVTMVV
jgi:hypothetical protein